MFNLKLILCYISPPRKQRKVKYSISFFVNKFWLLNSLTLYPVGLLIIRVLGQSTASGNAWDAKDLELLSTYVGIRTLLIPKTILENVDKKY